MNGAGMKYPTQVVIAALFCRTAVTAPEPVTCDSPCDCQNAHGEGRWSVKTDPSLPPTDASAIQAVTPSEMFGWPGCGFNDAIRAHWDRKQMVCAYRPRC